MQVLPDQFIRSLIPCDHKTGVWLSNGRFEKLLCSPARATSLSTDCCTFIFVFFCRNESGLPKWQARADNDRTLYGGGSSALLSCGGVNFGLIVLVVLEDVGEGREVETTCHSHQDEFKDPKSWWCIQTLRSTSSNQSTHTHKHSLSHNGYSCYMNVLTNWQQQSCDPKINLAP